MKRGGRLAGVVVCLVTTTARAEEGETTEGTKALPCRPTIACTSDIVPEGLTEVEVGYSARRSAPSTLGSGQLLLKLSLLDWIQIQAGTAAFLTTGSGTSTHAVDGFTGGLKLRLDTQHEVTPGLAVSAHVTVPTMTMAEALQRTPDASFWGYASKDIGRFHGDLNLALTVFDVGAVSATQGLSALAISMDMGRGFGVMTELYSAFGDTRLVPIDGGWLNALSYSPADSWVFDIGGDVGLYSATRAFTLFAGLTVVPYRITRRPPSATLGSRPSVAQQAHP